MVPEEEIIAVLSTSALPQEAADLLIAAANAHGGADNIA
jgi:serine/threonine protein phosphatase PrpC